MALNYIMTYPRRSKGRFIFKIQHKIDKNILTSLVCCAIKWVWTCNKCKYYESFLYSFYPETGVENAKQTLNSLFQIKNKENGFWGNKAMTTQITRYSSNLNKTKKK